jgi:hypothetical protein
MLVCLGVSLILVGLLVAAACCARPEWMARMDLDVWELPGLLSRVEQERQREASLNLDAANLQDLIQRKEEVLTELLAGRLTLAQATARFRGLVSSSEGFWCYVRLAHPALPEAESVGRYLIDWAGQRLAERPERTRVLARLRAELEEMQRDARAQSSV